MASPPLTPQWSGRKQGRGTSVRAGELLPALRDGAIQTYLDVSACTHTSIASFPLSCLLVKKINKLASHPGVDSRFLENK